MSETDGNAPATTHPSPREPWTRQHILHAFGLGVAVLAIVVAAIVGMGTLGTWRTNVANRQDTVTKSNNQKLDDQIDSRINKNATLALILQKTEDVRERLGKLEGWKDGVNDKVRGLKLNQENQGKQQEALNKEIAQQRSVNKLQDPSHVFASIRFDLERAESANRILPVSDVVEYKNALSAFSTASKGYWTIVAAVINYQSFVNQLNGSAPDPTKIAKPCFGMTARNGVSNNFFNNGSATACFVDLDRSESGFMNFVFKDCVIRYYGGPILLQNVRFVNCRFYLNLPPEASPSQQALIMALLNSVNQKSIIVRSD